MAKYNKNFGKLVDGKLQYAPNPIKTDNGIIWSNEPEAHLEYGYKAIVLTERPVKEGYYYGPSWIEHETTIEQGWIEYEEIKPELPEE